MTLSPSRRGRVVILVENLPVPIDRRTWQEARTLTDVGWDVTVIGPKGPDEMRASHVVIDGVEVLRYPQRAASGLLGYLAEYLPSIVFTAYLLFRTARRGRIDVIHGCNPPDLFWLFGKFFKRRGAAYVFDQHDANPELSLTKFGSGGLRGRMLHRLTLGLERASYRTADEVLVPNDSYAEVARRRGGVPADRVHVIRNAPDPESHRRLMQHIAPEGKRVGYIGVFGSQDGLEILIDAWARVVREPDLGDAVLEMVGDGEARPVLVRAVAAAGIAGSVRFHGYLQPREFVPILARCRLTVSPDPPTPFNAISTMVKVVDSLVIGRPVICFDLAETRRLIGEAGKVVMTPGAEHLAAAIAALLRDPDEAQRLGELAAARVDALDLSWDRSAEVLRAAYERLVPEADRGAATG